MPDNEESCSELEVRDEYYIRLEDKENFIPIDDI